ncbi:MAG: hypothetical protein HGA86_08050 [Anaerolineaceae bacterium]|nr:hypothetical protein [Anaerolineaceae bacterium]
MKKIILPVISFLLGFSSVYSQQMLWSYGTARTLPTGQQEFGIYRVRISENV